MKKIIILIWVLIVCISFSLYIIYPELFSREQIAQWANRFELFVWPIYLLICVLRGFTLLPTTPFLLAGMLLFPNQPILLFSISLLGVFLSSTIIYYFSSYIGFDMIFRRKYPKQTIQVSRKLQTPYGYFFVAFWSFFPFVPTDLVTYLAGSLKIKFIPFMLAVLIGATPLLLLYIYGGTWLIGL